MVDFGKDLKGTTGLDPSGRLVDGSKGDVTIVAEAIYRRLITPRGALIYDPDYGLDIKLLLNQGYTSAGQANIINAIANEINKEERIDDFEIEIDTFSQGVLDLRITCTTSEGPFELTLTITEAAALLTGLEIG